MAIAPLDTATLINGKDLDSVLATDLPVLLLNWNGETLKTDVKTELDKAAHDHAGRIQVVKVDASKNPDVAERFDFGKYPLLIGLHNGETLGRRNRPWGTDVQGIVEELLKVAPALDPKVAAEKEKEKEKALAASKPVHVTDKTFEKEV